MKNIIVSLMVILVVGALSFGATQAYFSSDASVENNTFATGTLEIRVNGQPTKTGFTVTNAIPGTCQSGQFGINNYGAPWFAGPSTLAAKYLKISAVQDGGNTNLYNALTVTVEANRGWATWMPVYSGNVSSLTAANLLSPRWTELAPGNSEDVKYTVCLPESGDQSSLQGLSTSFDFVVEARTN